MKTMKNVLFVSINIITFLIHTISIKLKLNSKLSLTSKDYPYNTETYFFSNKMAINPNKTNPEWMKQIGDDTLLSQISIPGTHDTAANKLNLEKYKKSFHILSPGKIYRMFRAQSLDINDQLMMGIRYLDIRLKSDGVIYHKYYPTDKNFTQVVDVVKQFLTNHPSETVIMRIKDEDKSDGVTISSFLNQMFLKYKDLFSKLNKVPTMKEIRGKIIPFIEIKNFNKDYFTWEDKSIMKLQDNFVVWFRGLKRQSIINFQNNQEKDPKLFYFNHISGTQGMFLVDIQNTAYAINNVVFELHGKNLGVVILDYPSENIVEHIFKRNFAAESAYAPVITSKSSIYNLTPVVENNNTNVEVVASAAAAEEQAKSAQVNASQANTAGKNITRTPEILSTVLNNKTKFTNDLTNATLTS